MRSADGPGALEAGAPEGGAPADAAEALAGCRAPYLIGVRHHSPALAAAVPQLLAAAAPEVLFVELPGEFARWLPYLADPATVQPVALAGHGPRGLVFLPFADFSPELVAIRWAAEAGVPVVPFDLPLGARGDGRAGQGEADGGQQEQGEQGQQGGQGAQGAWPERALERALRERAGGRAEDDLWNRLVEAAAPGGTAEALRRAALLLGWALRQDAARGGRLDPYDLRREAHMRRLLAARPGVRAAAVVGAFHGPALVPGAGGTEPDDPAGPDDVAEVATSLVPYTYPLLDERSGYPAGIRDPEWQLGVVRAAGDPERLDALLLGTAVRICAAVRAAGHPCGPPDAREVVRHARDLASLRGLPAAGRGELLEAVRTVLTQGQLLGRGRVVARALEEVLVGTRHGRPAPGTPRSGLGPAVESLLAELGLPAPGAPERRELRLDPYRSPLDRRRELALRQLVVCGVPYGEPAPTAGTGGTAGIGTRWTVEWTPATAAMLEATAVHGSELPFAAEGLLRQRARNERRDGGPAAAEVLTGLTDAASCGLPGPAADRLAETARLLPVTGTLPELLAGLGLLDRLASGHFPGLDAGWEAAAVTAARAEVTAAGVRALDGLAGSDDPADALALAELAARGLPGLRMADALTRLAAEGTPLIRGAAGAALVLLGETAPGAFGTVLAARTEDATTAELREGLAGFLTGALTAAGPLVEAEALLAPLVETVEALRDRGFLTRLPALRRGFDALTPAARERLLATVRDGAAFGPAAPAGLDPAAAARHTGADLAGREALAALGLLGVLDGDLPAAAVDTPQGRQEGSMDDVITADVRWQLLLGRVKQRSAARMAAALDELYGAGRGEGAEEMGRSGAGSEAPYPDVRSWAEELQALFGAGVREEVLAAAAAAGRLDAALEMDPAAARPSVELLRTVLSFAGGLPEGQLARLRPLVARLVRELTQALANRMRPALVGLTHPRPTRRPGGPLDLPRTLRANLATARRDPVDGTVTVLPERPVFRTRARKAADWRIVLVVDVSGSMEASTIWSAVTAAVLSGVPALSTHFVAFSTEVVDLTGQVDDPLSLLLEVRVGGGTNIARGLRHARGLVTVPSRTLVVLVSDFEEGGPVGALLGEVRALVESGCHVLGCASLDDAGRGRYSVGVAGQLVAAGMPVAALSPLELARWVGERVSGGGSR